jgi:hypothetical protein
MKIPRLTLSATSSERAGCGVLLCRLLLARFGRLEQRAQP